MRAYYLFGRSPLPDKLNDEIQATLAQLNQYTDKSAYLRQAYEIITHRFTSSRSKTLYRIHELFAASIDDLWNRTKFLHCTNQNYLLSLLLLKSGMFTEQDISPRWTRIWVLSPHQYLHVRIGPGQTVDVDCWARHYGVPFGQHANGFNTSRLKAFAD